MVRTIASPDGNRLVYSFGKYFHAPVPFALPIRALDLESGEVETMEQIAGVDTRSLQWSGKADLWAACRSGPLLDSLCRLKNDGSVDRSEEHTSELQSLMANSYAVLCLK